MSVDLGPVLAAHHANVGFDDLNSDNNPWGPVQGIVNAPYCDSAASVVPWQNGYRWWPESQCGEKGCAYCPYHINVGKAHGEFAYDHESTGSPVDVTAGDLLFYGWNNGNEPADHVETAIEDSPSGRTHNIGYNTGTPKGCHDLWRDRKYLIGRLRPTQYSGAVIPPVAVPTTTGTPQRMYDGVTWQGLPADAPVVGGYVNHKYAWPDAAWLRFSGLWVPIAVYVPGSGDDPRQVARDQAAVARRIGLPVGVTLCLDVESPNAQQAHDEGFTSAWADEVTKGGDFPADYTSQSAQGVIASDGFSDHWGAQYNGVDHLNPGDAATQWASPDTGSGGPWDLSTTSGAWPRRPGGAVPVPVPNPPPPPPVQPSVHAPDDNPYTILDEDGQFGNHSIHACQWKTGAAPDGVFGRLSAIALQNRLGVSADGQIGPVTVEALQRRVGAGVDGQWGPDTTTHFQHALNLGSF